jgi:hypothetical protein
MQEKYLTSYPILRVSYTIDRNGKKIFIKPVHRYKIAGILKGKKSLHSKKYAFRLKQHKIHQSVEV